MEDELSFFAFFSEYMNFRNVHVELHRWWSKKGPRVHLSSHLMSPYLCGSSKKLMQNSYTEIILQQILQQGLLKKKTGEESCLQGIVETDHLYQCHYLFS